MGPGEGGQGADRASARVEDLRAFVESGAVYVAALTAIFETIADTRAAANGALEGLDTPHPRVAKRGYGGNVDPLGELIAEATINNGFVETVHDGFAPENFAVNGVRSVPAATIDVALRTAGFQPGDDDASLQDDRALAEALSAPDLDEVRANLTADQQAAVDDYRERLEAPGGTAVPFRITEIDDPDVRMVVADLIIEHAIVASRNPNRSQHLPFGHDAWMGVNSLVHDVEGTPLQVFVAHRLVEEGLALEAEIGHIQATWPDDERNVAQNLQETAIVMVTLGLTSMNDEQRINLVAGFEHDPDRARLIVQALDLDDNESGNLDDYVMSGVAAVGRGDRQVALAGLLEVAVDDGVIRTGGQDLFDASMQGLLGSGWHPGLPSADDTGTSSDRLRSALVAIAGAPNFGLTDDEYQQALEVDRLFDELPLIATEEETLQLDMALAALASGDQATVDFILSAMMADMSAAEALRIARSSAPRPQGPYNYQPDYSPTDDRVDVLRLLLGTDRMGNPPLLEDAVAGGLPEAASGSIISELRILQALQMDRWNQGKPIEATPPLSIEQLELVAGFEQRLGDVDELTWALWEQRLAESGGAAGLYGPTVPTQYETLEAIASGEVAADPELVALATALTSPSADEVWGILIAAPNNTKFLNPDGTFGGYDDDFDTRLLRFPGYEVGESNFTSLNVQLLLHNELAPTATLLDGNDDGLITENDRDNWLRDNAGDIPPVLRDRIRFGAGFGLGHDDWGWDELAEGLGIVGLTAAVVVTVVYSGGTAAPLWVKAGLVTLAGAEAIAAIYAGDELSAGLALFGGAADGVSFLRLLARGRRVPTGSLLGLADNPGVWDDVTDVERARAYDAVVADARGSDIPALRELAEQSGDLTPAEFLNRYREIAADNPDAYLAQIADPVRRTIARRELDKVWQQRLRAYPPEVRSALAGMTPSRQRAFYNDLRPDEVVDVRRYGHDSAVGVHRLNQDGDLVVSFPEDGIEVTVRGAADYDDEIQQIAEFMRHDGGGGRFEFFGPSSEGVEGLYYPVGSTQGVPVSLKGHRNTGRLSNLIRRINVNAGHIVQANQAGDAVWYGQVNFSTVEVANFVRNGPIATMPNEGVFARLVFQATDGVVEVTAAGVTVSR